MIGGSVNLPSDRAALQRRGVDADIRYCSIKDILGAITGILGFLLGLTYFTFPSAHSSRETESAAMI